MIDIKDLCKVYLVGEERVRALDHATLHIYPHEFVSIIGPSGSGKSTLMNIIGCLDPLGTSGTVFTETIFRPLPVTRTELVTVRMGATASCAA